MRVKDEREKVGLKLSIQRTKIMAFGLITSWKIEKMWKQSKISFRGSPKSLQMVTAAMKLKVLGRKGMTNLDSILKSKAISLPTNVCIVKAVVFPGVVYKYESWTIKKAEC